jgi:hypothetical protein
MSSGSQFDAIAAGLTSAVVIMDDEADTARAKCPLDDHDDASRKSCAALFPVAAVAIDGPLYFAEMPNRRVNACGG